GPAQKCLNPAQRTEVRPRHALQVPRLPLALDQRAYDVGADRLDQQRRHFVRERVSQREDPQVVLRVRHHRVENLDQFLHVLHVGGTCRHQHAIARQIEVDAEEIERRAFLRKALAVQVAQLHAHHLGRRLLQGKRLYLQGVVDVQFFDFLDDVGEAALGPGDEQGVVARHGDAIDVLRDRWADRGEGIAGLLPHGLRNDVALLADLHPREHRVQNAGDRGAILVAERHEAEFRLRAFRLPADELENLENDLHVASVGGANDGNAELALRYGGNGAAGS